MPYTLQCPHCGHRVFHVHGTCRASFQGEIDCTAWTSYEEGADVDVLSVEDWNTTDEDVDRIECEGCGKRIDFEEATAAYEAARQEYLNSLPDPRQIPLFPSHTT